MLQKALIYTWIFYSVIALAALGLSFFLPENTVYKITPTCYSVKQFGKECILCGSTRSFVAIGKGKWQQAWNFNKIATVLYIVILINSCILALYISTSKYQKSLCNKQA